MTVRVEGRHRPFTRADRDTRIGRGLPARPRRLELEVREAPRVDRRHTTDQIATIATEARRDVDQVSTERHATSLVLSVVIPTRNEARNIAWVLERMPPFVDEVVIVDGGSTDGTVDVARSIRPDVVVVRDNGRGKGDAMRVGAAAANGSLIVMMDADGSMDPGEIERFVEPLARGYEFVKGSRFLEGGGTADMTRLRMIGNWGLNLVSNILFRAGWTDLCYGYCAFRRSALEDLSLDADGFEIETQMVTRATRSNLRTVEVPSFEYERRFGNSNLNTFRDGFRVLFTILRERLRPTAPRLVPDESPDA
jgi:glycosyltransferase involved in cell wall biosynthesis